MTVKFKVIVTRSALLEDSGTEPDQQQKDRILDFHQKQVQDLRGAQHIHIQDL